MSNLTSVIIPNNVISIGDSAFYNCNRLDSLSLGGSISTYGKACFSGCTKLKTIYNYRTHPANLARNVFEGLLPFYGTLYVLDGSVEYYKSSSSDWKDYFNIEPVKATNSQTDKVEINPNTNTADIVWPVVSGAATYELVIRDTNGNIICTLTFNAQGQLIAFAFNAPKRGNVPQQTQVAGFKFTINSLKEGTTYHYTLMSKDTNGNTLNTQTGSFRTKGGTAVVHTLIARSSDKTMGTVTGGGEYGEGETVTIEAVPVTGYRFVEWNDGNTDNPRTVTVIEDMTFTARFEKIPDALEDANIDSGTSSPRKVQIDGILYILMPDGRIYDLHGTEVK